MLPFNEDSDISASDSEGLGSESEAPGSVPGVCAAIVSLSFSIKAGVTYALESREHRSSLKGVVNTSWLCDEC